MTDSTKEPPLSGSEIPAGDFITHSSEETFELAKRIAERTTGGEVFLLHGDLGAGKTVFAKGIGAGLGIDPTDVTSPTFTLVNEYEGRLRFYHIDLYRLEPGDHKSLGIEEILEDETSVTVIEWAERLGEALEKAFVVAIDYVSNSERKLQISRS
jgi:tRNA threonylcarbamoyladenosine biosynthesis protein TsaE